MKTTATDSKLPTTPPDLEGKSEEMRNLELLRIGHEAGLWTLELMDVNQDRFFAVNYKGRRVLLDPAEVPGFCLGVAVALGLPTTPFATRSGIE